ncbi:hypothetical protein I7I51_04524 [Histoplasma capsulatum]|uniref:Uncharacterized protein n=1 Tax=Ajellomyces capsulatus TaxID=5037 RepID=A0A8A1M762_AJECA|nr:hypothetical protein I7I51_04524 [Histoplasma capsulatum]
MPVTVHVSHALNDAHHWIAAPLKRIGTVAWLPIFLGSGGGWAMASRPNDGQFATGWKHWEHWGRGDINKYREDIAPSPTASHSGSNRKPNCSPHTGLDRSAHCCLPHHERRVRN